MVQITELSALTLPAKRPIVCEVTGALTPDVTGWYLPRGMYNDRPYFRREDESYFIWWDDVAAWWLTDALGVQGYAYWGHTDPSVLGEYTPWNAASGIATITVYRFAPKAEATYYRVYRGQDGNMDYENIQAVMSVDAAQVSIPNQALPPNTIWHYIRRQVRGCGLESDDSPVCKVIIDSDGNMIGSTPNPPLDLVVEQLSGGKLKLRWRYTLLEEEITPTSFSIYMDSGSGFNFDTPTATVFYGLGGMGEFQWTSEALTHGQLYRFCVRSYRAGAGETQNTDFVAALADSVGPDAITGLRATWQEV